MKTYTLCYLAYNTFKELEFNENNIENLILEIKMNINEFGTNFYIHYSELENLKNHFENYGNINKYLYPRDVYLPLIYLLQNNKEKGKLYIEKSLDLIIKDINLKNSIIPEIINHQNYILNEYKDFLNKYNKI